MEARKEIVMREVNELGVWFALLVDKPHLMSPFGTL
jgi:hypothetical protein